MAKNPDAKPRVTSALRADFSGHRPDATPRQKPSALVDTRVIYCGDNREQLKKCSLVQFEISCPMSSGEIH